MSISVRYRYLLCGLLLLGASCSEEKMTDDSMVRSPYETVQITAGIPMTRIVTSADKGIVHFLWERGDLITLATADQQLSYVTTNNGPSAYFYSVSTGSDQPEDFLKNVEGKTVYARYPYNNRTPIDMDALTTPVASGSHFLYAVDTIRQAKLNLNFRHAMAYLRFHVKHDPFPEEKNREIGGKLDVGYPGQNAHLILKGNFDYALHRIIPTDTASVLDIPYEDFLDSVSLFPVAPIAEVTEVAFELRCRTNDFYFHDRITQKLPAGGLQAGRVYDVYLDYRQNQTKPDTGDVMSETQQKAYLESVALELLDRMPSKEFKEIAELGRYMRDIYIDSYDWSGVEKWSKDIYESLRSPLGTTTVDTLDVWGGSNYTYYDISYFSNYKAVLLASNFTGHFTAENGRWTRSAADNLEFAFLDKAGSECLLKLETGGEVKKVHLFNLDDWVDYDSNSPNDSTRNYNEYYDRTQCTIGVPERVTVTLTQGGEQLFRCTLQIQMGSITNEQFDLSKDNLTLSSLLELNNGYKVNLSQLVYEANKKASVLVEMSNSGGTLFSASMTSDLKDIPSCNVEAFSRLEFDDIITDDTNAKNAYVKLDLLGKVQIQGVMPDVRLFCDHMNSANDNDENEELYKSYIGKANGTFDFNLFYDGQSIKQAAIKFEPFLYDSWGDYTWWDIEPALHFYDGSSYSLFEAFFNETEFKRVIDTFKMLSNRYADLVGEEIEW